MASRNGVDYEDNPRGRIAGRSVHFFSGKQEDIRKQIPDFELRAFRAEPQAEENPYLRTVCRLPMHAYESLMPVGVVSSKYSLLTHKEAFDHCIRALQAQKINTSDLLTECGLSELGEWMNLSIYLPKEYDYVEESGERMSLRLECFNSVEGSSRFTVLFGWYRFVCSNGMIIGETKAEFRDTHDERLDLDPLPVKIGQGLKLVEKSIKRMRTDERTAFKQDSLEGWINETVSKTWGKIAATRAFSICNSGYDCELQNPFQKGKPSEKRTKPTIRVPGCPEKAVTPYDVGQALSWVATSTNDLASKSERQSEVQNLLQKLPTEKKASKYSPDLIEAARQTLDGLF